jgi:FkbM family methyltransferase
MAANLNDIPGRAGPPIRDYAAFGGMRLLRSIGRSAIQAGSRIGVLPFVQIRGGPGKGLKLSLENASGNYWSGSNELPVQMALTRFLRPGDIFYDVGSNIGFFSLIAARLVGPSGGVVAIEPVPGNAAVIRRNMQRNDFTHVQILEIALGAEPGVAALHVTKHPGGATLSTTEIPPDATGTIRVTVKTLDDLTLTEKLGTPRLVKIDVEGTELEVMKGMTQTLAAFEPVILFEIDAPDTERLEAKSAAIRAFLEAHRYQLHPLEKSYQNMAWEVRHAIALPEGQAC